MCTIYYFNVLRWCCSFSTGTKEIHWWQCIIFTFRLIRTTFSISTISIHHHLLLTVVMKRTLYNYIARQKQSRLHFRQQRQRRPARTQTLKILCCCCCCCCCCITCWTAVRLFRDRTNPPIICSTNVHVERNAKCIKKRRNAFPQNVSW